MIKDQTKWHVGISKLSSFMQYVREPFEEERVEEFHKIVATLEEGSGHDLSHFKIPAEKLQLEAVGAQISTDFSGAPPRTIYSKNKRCDGAYFRSQIHALANYIQFLQGPKPVNKPNPYESLSDDQLQEMLVNRNIKPKRIVDERGERRFYDRSHALAELLKSDRPEASAPTHSTVINMHSSSLNYQSAGASITQTMDYKSENFRELLSSLKEFAATQNISPSHRDEINIFADTIEVQLKAQRPNPTIIGECLKSVRTILENAAGSVFAAPLIAAIARHLPT